MKNTMTIEEIANGYMELFATTGMPYYFMMYRSLNKLADETYNVEVTKTEEDAFTL